MSWSGVGAGHARDMHASTPLAGMARSYNESRLFLQIQLDDLLADDHVEFAGRTLCRGVVIGALAHIVTHIFGLQKDSYCMHTS